MIIFLFFYIVNSLIYGIFKIKNIFYIKKIYILVLNIVPYKIVPEHIYYQNNIWLQLFLECAFYIILIKNKQNFFYNGETKRNISDLWVLLKKNRRIEFSYLFFFIRKFNPGK